MSRVSKFSKDIREEWFKAITMAFAFLAFLGLFKSIVFYRLFGISILSYIQWDEFVLVAFEDLMWTIIFFVLGNFVPFLFISNKTLEKESQFSFSNRLLGISYASVIVCILVALFFLFILPIFYEGLYIFESLLLTYSRWYSIAVFWAAIFLFFGSPVFIYGFGCLELLLYVRKMKLGEAFNIYRILITFCCFTLYVEVITLCNQYIHVKDNKYKGSTFETAKTTYKIDDNNVYIGRTRQYIFVKSYIKDKIIVIPVVQITEENIKEIEWKYVKVRKI